jgi:amino acid transporter
VVVLCCVWNLRGAPAVGEDSVWMFALLLAPFASSSCSGFWRWIRDAPGRCNGASPGLESALSTAILVAMWNYMGWDNASTVAQEVENPQRNYPRAMIACHHPGGRHLHSAAGGDGAGRAFRRPAFPPATGCTAAAIGGPLLGLAVVAGGCITGIGMFNALVMSYTRLPMAMAEDGMLPRVVAGATAAACPG